MRHRLHLVKSKRNFPTMMTSYQCRRTDNVIRTDPNIERFFFNLITHHLDLRLFLTFPFLISSNINLIERNGDPYHRISVHIQTQVQFLS